MVYYDGDLRFYLSALEEELLKIHVFRRELPLCYEVVAQTIEAWKLKLKDEVSSPGHPVLEEFMALRDVDVDDDDDDDDVVREETRSGWLRSARLWNPIPDLNAQQDNGDEECPAALPQKPPLSSAVAIRVKSTSSPERQQRQRRGRDECKASGVLLISPAGSSIPGKATGKGEGKQKQKEGSARMKKRRCWSAELHRRFLNALHELGGSHGAALDCSYL